ncbi:MAG: hypothetical protein LBM77_03785 [Spirochaetaceae bacterium]|jgi:hypothetical protein|nr:hypothetical protein [Spirochaetaceae bacterium]
MLNTLKKSSVRDEIVAKDGRVFRFPGQPVLDCLPPDIVKNLAQRRLDEAENYLNKAQAKPTAKPKRKTGLVAA